jgi:hypothetical protein
MGTRIATICMNASRPPIDFCRCRRSLQVHLGLLGNLDCLISVESCLLGQFNPLLRL